MTEQVPVLGAETIAKSFAACAKYRLVQYQVDQGIVIARQPIQPRNKMMVSENSAQAYDWVARASNTS